MNWNETREETISMKRKLLSVFLILCTIAGLCTALPQKTGAATLTDFLFFLNMSEKTAEPDENEAANCALEYPQLIIPQLTTRLYNVPDSSFNNPITLLDPEGNIHFVYENGDNIVIKVFNQNLIEIRTLTVPKLLPKLGSATIDTGGNYYIAYGKDITDERNQNEQNIAIAKYNMAGRLSGSTYFMGGEGSSNGTKEPFCDLPSMAISRNVLALHFNRIMFRSADGLNHQSSTALFVDIDTMSSVDLRAPYASHSLDQAVIATHDGGFLFAERGDAYPRGFLISKVIWDTVSSHIFSFTPFHFRELAPYQSTNSDLGGIAESNHGYLLAGTSERVLSNFAISASGGRPQDLFIQMIDEGFYGQKNDRDKIVSNGVTRKSEGIQNSLGLNYSGGQSYFLPADAQDHGVVWLTSYQDDQSAVYPKLVAQEDGFILLWERWGSNNNSVAEYLDTWYMMLSADGSVTKPATRIDKDPRLNHTGGISYDNGKIFWSSANNSEVTLYALDVGGNRFAPNGTLTRTQIAAIVNRVARALGATTEDYAHSFTDVADHWVSAELGWLEHTGIIQGFGGNNLDPNGNLTTEQAIAITYCALNAFCNEPCVGG